MVPLIALTLICLSVAQLDAFSKTQTGDGTFYGGNDQGGNCALWPLPSFASGIKRVAMNELQYASGDQSRGCGMCVSISGIPGMSSNVIAVVTDRCPECLNGAIDLGWSGDGRFPISWKAIDCPVQGNLQYKFEGSHNYYMKLQVRNNRIPVSKLEFQTPSGSWLVGTRTQDNFFLATGYPFPVTLPINVRVTGINGNSVIDKISSISMSPFNGGNGVQLTGISSGSSSPQSTPKPVPQSTPKPAPTPKASPQSTPKASPQSTPKSTPQSTPKSAPQSGSSCSGFSFSSATSEWWVEIEGPAGRSVSAKCGDGRSISCTPKWGKYICDPKSTACNTPRKISCQSSNKMEEEETESSSLPAGAIAGICIGGILFVALIVGAVVVALRRQKIPESF